MCFCTTIQEEIQGQSFYFVLFLNTKVNLIFDNLDKEELQ